MLKPVAVLYPPDFSFAFSPSVHIPEGPYTLIHESRVYFPSNYNHVFSISSGSPYYLLSCITAQYMTFMYYNVGSVVTILPNSLSKDIGLSTMVISVPANTKAGFLAAAYYINGNRYYPYSITSVDDPCALGELAMSVTSFYSRMEISRSAVITRAFTPTDVSLLTRNPSLPLKTLFGSSVLIDIVPSVNTGGFVDIGPTGYKISTTRPITVLPPLPDSEDWY